MRSPKSLREWVRRLLPTATPLAHHAATVLLRALLVGYTANLSQLARQMDRISPAKGTGQWLRRWLDRPHFGPATLYPCLLRLIPEAVWDQPEILLLIDATCLADRWVVLQVSIPWEGRALPVWREVYPYAGADRTKQGQRVALEAALAGLGAHLPGSRAHYVLIMDRGFPSNRLVSRLQRDGWRFVLRVKSNWRMEHPEYTGLLREAVSLGLVTATPRLLREARLGYWEKGRDRRSTAHVVFFYGPQQQEAWFLVTSEVDPQHAVALYARRMQIEEEFRDLKGPCGLDLLADWEDLERVRCFLAWVAVYEWRLAYLWVTHQLCLFRERLRTGGRISWIRTVREWIAREIRLARPLFDLRL
jgi:hypothetical protein